MLLILARMAGMKASMKNSKKWIMANQWKWLSKSCQSVCSFFTFASNQKLTHTLGKINFLMTADSYSTLFCWWNIFDLMLYVKRMCLFPTPFYVQIQSLMLTYVESLLNILVSFKQKKYWHVHDHFLRILQNNTSVGFRCPFRLCLTNLTPFLSASQKK